MIILRPKEVDRIKQTKKWVLIYGRRKTGKTFIIENFIDYDDYFFIKRDKTIILKDTKITYETFMEILKRDLSESKTVIVDEFHRLGDNFLDFLQYTKKQGRVILISSTLHLSKQFFSSHSPILGFFAELPIGLIEIRDCIEAIARKRISKKYLVEMAVLLREPLSIEEFGVNQEPREILKKVLISSINTVPSLVGEIFTEEERRISAIYEGILRAIAGGDVTSGKISSYLFSAKLIQKDDPSLIQQHLNNLVKFGIIKKLSIYNKKRFVYKHVSPLARLFYYADEKYNISERKMQITDQEIARIINEITPKIVEDNIREFLTKEFGLIETIIEARDYDIDALLLRFKKPEIAIEIKWKEKIANEDLAKAEKNLSRIMTKKKFLFVPDKTKIKTKQKFNFDIVDISDFV